MKIYKPLKSGIWSGREASGNLYFYQKVQLTNLEEKEEWVKNSPVYVLLGYASDEGVRRNKGRVGAQYGPIEIRKQLGKLPHHLHPSIGIYDAGDILCYQTELEKTQAALEEKITAILKQGAVPVVLGGSHDLSYGHFKGIRKFTGNDKTIGIINFDAHFDLRKNTRGNNSGTPFYQIAEESKKDNTTFKYLCLGIRENSNDAELYETAQENEVVFIENERFNLWHKDYIIEEIEEFLNSVDFVYLTIDLDGFSSAYAPGVSSPSPMGFSTEIVLECLKTIIKSKKLISLDVVELNPLFDVDQSTAKLAASLIYFCIHKLALL
ncbi:formimidoylglutamase [Eudoraea chungangensis]|uniref:formimidoylglutamase n=1 Tax=Eudoraea chungangensis TaxID=1481905 RepID=UPI0023ED6513|nr:formimidoylglutamase [Eudoraea chungangensis]